MQKKAKILISLAVLFLLAIILFVINVWGTRLNGAFSEEAGASDQILYHETAVLDADLENFENDRAAIDRELEEGATQ